MVTLATDGHGESSRRYTPRSVFARVRIRCGDGRGGCVYTWKDIGGWEHRVRASAQPPLPQPERDFS
jgi:hypothetical protein